jgi:hypothetical protein
MESVQRIECIGRRSCTYLIEHNDTPPYKILIYMEIGPLGSIQYLDLLYGCSSDALHIYFGASPGSHITVTPRYLACG